MIAVNFAGHRIHLNLFDVTPNHFYDRVINYVGSIESPDEVQVLVVADVIEVDHRVVDGREQGLDVCGIG